MNRLWDLAALAAPPPCRTIERAAGAEGVLFAAEPYRGRATEVFAYLAAPPGRGPFPAMVCLHAGGGRACSAWVEAWTARGYAAIAPDLDARGPGGLLARRARRAAAERGRRARAGPGRPRALELSRRRRRSLSAEPPRRPAGGRRGAHRDRRGELGGSLACVAAGLEPRFAAGASVFGSGFLQSESGRERSRLFAGLSAAERRRWHQLFDPASHLPRCRRPLLFASGARDGGFPLDILERTAALPPVPVFRAVRPEMDHGHEAALRCREVYRFADHALRGAPPPPRVSAIERRGDRLAATVDSVTPIAAAALHVTRDRGEWKHRHWESAAARSASAMEARLPAGATACFFTVEDREGCLASSPPAEVEP